MAQPPRKNGPYAYGHEFDSGLEKHRFIGITFLGF